MAMLINSNHGNSYVEDLLREYARESPSRVVISSREMEISAGELDSLVDKDVRILESEGLHPGQRVAMVPRNTVKDLVTVLAICRSGIDLVLVNSRLTDVERDVIFDLCKPHRIIDENHPLRGGEEGGDVGKDRFGEGKLILFTSGSSGTPKGVVLSFASVIANCVGSEDRLRTGPEDTWLLTLPIFHTGGLMTIFRSLYSRMSIHLMEKFDRREVIRLLEEGKISVLSLVPTMLHRMVEEDIAALRRARVILLGGARPPDRLLRKCISEELQIYTTYGLTETCSQVATATPEQVYRDRTTVGHPLKGVKITIRGEDGQVVEKGKDGEIWVQGPNVMERYLGRDPTGGAIATGDRGFIDSRGELHVLGRISEMIITGGENVYPVEVEEELLAIDGVVKACVVGLKDEEWGEQVAAAVVGCGELSVQDLKEQLRGRIAGYKVPKTVVILDELPLNATGKVDKVRIRQILTDNKEQ